MVSAAGSAAGSAAVSAGGGVAGSGVRSSAGGAGCGESPLRLSRCDRGDLAVGLLRHDRVDLRLAALGDRLGDLRLGDAAVAVALRLRQRCLALGLLGLALGLLLGLAPRALLGLGAGALLGLAAGAVLLLAEEGLALLHDVADRMRDDRAGADRVVVARDDELDAVGVAVRVDQADDRDAQALGLAHGDRLGLEVDDEDRVRRALHVLHAAEVRPQLRQVGLGRQALAGGQQRELALLLVALEVVQALDPQADRLEVRQQPTEPAVVDEGHARLGGHLGHGVAGLLLRPDEQDGATAVAERRRELLRVVQELVRLQQVDEVDARRLTVDEAAHLGVPAARLVTEVDSGLQQLSDADVGHGYCSLGW